MIDPTLAAFLEEGLGIHIATRNAALHPNGSRALAVKIDDTGRQFVVFVSSVAAPRILPDLESNGQAAVSFGRPVDDRACQVKGVFIEARDAIDAERPFIAAQWEGFRANLAQIGIPREAMSGWVTWPAVAIRLRVNAIFEQTPGPGAGAKIA